MVIDSKRKIEIIPAILPVDFADLNEKIDQILGFSRTVQIDICDGQFTPAPSWPYKKHDDDFDKLSQQENGLPGWEKLDYEFDLMVNRPEEVVEQWVEVGATRIIVHVESRGDVAGAIEKLVGKAEIGLALNMDTATDVVEPFKDMITCVQLMAIDHIGFQGQTFNVKVIERVKAVREKYPNLTISVDGGVSLENAQLLIAAGAHRLIVGSAIFESDNPIDAVQKFNRIANS
jgi:ribulose-phosphate 3-epimerase